MPLPVLAIAWLIIGLCALLSARLARSGLRAGSLPEALMSMFFLGGAVLGYGPLVLRRTSLVDAGGAEILLLTSHAGFLLPVLAILLFTWRVFRPRETWALVLTWAVTAVVLGSFVLGYLLGPALGIESLSAAPGSAMYWVGYAARAVCFGWACSEAGLQWTRARRRTRLGLVDPLVANRFLLWAVWSGAASVLLGFRMVQPILMHLDDPSMPVPVWWALAQVAFGLACGGAVWLTFAPPALYRRWIAARHIPVSR